MAAERLRQFASAAAAAAVSIARPNYFDTSEIYELRSELNSDLQLVRKEAVKKVIASMTIGKDVSSIFPDVLKNIQTDDIELKKLVYLYLMNHAKSQPELVILAINTFCKDAEDPNPLVRALAIRTMGCLRVDKVLDYLCEPLQRALKDENAYVRKTAALCAAKVVELSPELAEENGFIEILKGMLADSNPSVLANVLAALSDIQAQNPTMGAFSIDSRTAMRLVSVLNDCTEWGQITILDALATYEPETEEEVIKYIEKVTPRLQHFNSSVVMSAVKVIIVYMAFLPADHQLVGTLKRKLAPPLVSMLSSPPEVQYVILRNINLILQKHCDILSQGVRVFFCKFNDPLYVKLEKLEIITLLIDEDNADQVLTELSEYAKEVDVEFARKAILTIANCTIKVPAASLRAFTILSQLIASNVRFIIQSVATAMHLILRRYPNDGTELIPPLLENMDIYDEDEARSAIVWIIGQYGFTFANTIELLGNFIENFALEPTSVQSEILTCSLKLFLRNPDEFRPVLHSIINKGLACNENADLRERCIIYGRILNVNNDGSSLTQNLDYNGLGMKPPSPTLLEDQVIIKKLLCQISTLASVYHRLPNRNFSEESTRIYQKPAPLPDLLSMEEDGDGGGGCNLSSSNQSHNPSPSAPEERVMQVSKSPQLVIDLLAD